MQRHITLLSAATRHATAVRSVQPLIATRGIAISNLPTAPGDYIPYDKGHPVKRGDRSLDKDTGDNRRGPPRERGERGDRGQRSYAGARDGQQSGGRGGHGGQFGAKQSRAVRTKLSGQKPPHILSLADLSKEEIAGLLRTAMKFKHLHKQGGAQAIKRSLSNQAVALLFSKRSTRTRVASESSTALLGGHAMFLGKDDIQLGVNESLEDSAKVIGSMVDGIMARVGAHAEVEVSPGISCS
jgi:hypothetical protein